MVKNIPNKFFTFFLLFSIIAGSTLASNSLFFVLAAPAIKSGEQLNNVGGTQDDLETLNKEIAVRKDKIKELEATMSDYKKNIAAKQNKAVSLKNQLSILDDQIGQLETDISLTQEKIKTAQLEIESLQLSINDKEKTIAKQKLLIIKMVQKIHSSDQKNYLEILLTYDNFADFYNELKNTESIYIDLGRSVKTLRLAKEDLVGRKAQIEAKRQEYQDLQNELETKKGELDQQVVVKKKILIDTKESEQRFQTLLSGLKQQHQLIENEERAYEDRVRKKLEEQNKIKPSGSVAFSYPVPSHHINALFHDPSYPYRRVFEHSGVDIKAAHGTLVRAAASGYVARARHCTASSCYSYVLIVHNGTISSVYGHLSSITTSDDQFVNKGDIIGYSGGTPGTVGAGPFVTGPHLHFEIRLNGIPVDPLPYLTE